MTWQRKLKRFLSGGGGSQDLSVARSLIFINLILFTLMVLHGTVQGLEMRAIMNPPTQLLVHWGAQFWPFVFNQGEWWRCITYAFTHGGLIHLAFNMIVLYMVGPRLEFEIGKAPFIVLYVFTALTGTLAGLLWHPMTPVVGASGALFGLIGFSVAYYHRIGTSIAIQMRNFMFQWAVFAFIFGLLVGADNAGHLGGAIGGVILGFLMPVSFPAQRRIAPFLKGLAAVCAALVVLSLGGLVLSWF
ncbi:rhomboid family intramembrane serine protease [Geoalkalibacter halelectricus]|uniref:Rhomboid family intramembrane serine protease n=1 Tax=Geoalkalibacter halelectricus TaxID=2847045 RepID=A0ABY5ZU89_9BACT|nr:rhomboid family intramembrane serine protease [Geoalkalibacter halelectricus]MDO3376992.1 rhomboid family intramembrane serine protease [Geoalkalibacter halelectricus]UWZ81214.1 rhomboid family intramembrane serine protease [Geoalkalibacter halelectricus]